MLRITGLCLLAVFKVVVTSESPLHCGRPPLGVRPSECCNFPPIFKEDDFKDCGIDRTDSESSPKPKPPDCTKQICLLKKYNLMKDDVEVDVDAVKKFMDDFAEENPDFKDAVEKSKERCIKADLPRPPHVCEPTAMVFCITNTMFMECPKWNNTENCNKIKEHIEACKSFYAKT